MVIVVRGEGRGVRGLVHPALIILAMPGHESRCGVSEFMSCYLSQFKEDSGKRSVFA